MSDIILSKSEENLDVANFLHTESFFCSSVHCSYYSSYQLMLYVLYEYFNDSEEDYCKTNEVNNAGSHNHLINLIRNEIRKINNDSIRDFDSNIRDLKELRKNADYKQIKIIPKDSRDAIVKTEKIRGIIKKTFSI